MPRNVTTSRTGITPSRNVLSLTRIAGAIRTVMDGAPVGDFEAPLIKDLRLRFGQGVATFTRASTASVTDFEGIIRQAKSGEARFEGARRVSNLVSTKSEDWTHASWIKTIGTVTATTLTSTGANQTVLQTYTGTGDFRLRVEMSRITGTGNIDLTVNGGVTWTTVTLTGFDQTFSILGTGITNPQFGIRIVTSGDAINAAKIQLEDVTGQANKNPSEYVSVGVLTAAPYHGANVDSVKYVTTLNANTVTNNVVTEATGAAIPDAILKGYLAEGQRTNLLTYSEQFDNAAWMKTLSTATADTIAAPSGASTADTLKATTVLGTILQSVTSASADRTFSVCLKRKTGTGTISLTVDNGATWTPVTITSSWARYTITQTAVTNPIVGVRISDLNDEVYAWGSQLESASFASSYIPTTTASVTRNADVLTYPTAGNVTLNLPYSLYFEGATNSDTSTTQYSFIGSNSSYLFSVFKSAAQVRYYSENPSLPASISVSYGYLSTPAKYAVSMDGVYSSFFTNGVKSTIATVPVSNTSLISIGSRNTISQLYGTIRNVKIWKKALTDTQLTDLTR